jgi:hypothetical protein
LVAHGIIFGYAMNPNVEAGLLNNVIGKTLNEAGRRLFGIEPYSTDEHENYLQPFSRAEIYALLSNNNYAQVITQIATSPANSEVELVNYNWYDISLARIWI